VIPDEILGLILLGALLIVIFIGFPIAFTLIILAIIFGYLGFGPLVFDLMVIQTMGLMSEEVLAAVPLFVFMGYILERAGLVDRLFRAFQLLMAPVRGSLYIVVILTATIFATATGIIGAAVTLLGILSASTMLKAGYDRRLAAGAITAGGTLGILIPPSVMLVLLGPVAGISVIRLFAAAFVPGLFLSVLYLTYTLVRCYLNPRLGPPLPPELRAKSFGEILRELIFGIIPLATLIFAALGSILAGLATPTEAAAMGAFAALVLAALYRRLNFRLLRDAVVRTLETTSMILFLAVSANFYAAVFGRLGTGTWLTEQILALPVDPMVMLILIMGLIFLLGWPLEWPAIILIFLPIILPVVQALGFNLLWFCILVAVNLQTAFLSPPVAVAAYYLKGVAPEFDLKDIYAGMLEFMVLQLVGLALVFLFPDLALWLPRLLYGGE